MSEKTKMPINIRLSEDYYKAYIELKFNDQEEPVTAEEVVHALHQRQVTVGLLHERIVQICETKQRVHDAVVAEGTPHVNGRDASLKEMVSFRLKAEPQVNEDGTVDFKNMGFVETVKKGDVLVVKIPATAGSQGHTVTNRIIKPRQGKETTISAGENTLLSEDGLTLIADIDGIAKILNGRYTVVNIIELNQVGPETGNIYFGGDVHVKENVLSGYTITCDGDLTIDGVVEGCTLKVKGNLTVAKGILGNGTSDIVVEGALVSKFIENASVYVKGRLETGEIINSTVLCDDKIVVKGKKGLIIGGEITSKYMIDANRIGSRLGVLTTINLGISADTIQEIKCLKETIHALKILITKLDSVMPALKERVKEDPNNQGLKDKVKQYEDSLLSATIDLEEKTKRYDHLMAAMAKVREGKIHTNTLYPDTIVKIGDARYFIDHTLNECIISRSDDKVIAIGHDLNKA